MSELSRRQLVLGSSAMALSVGVGTWVSALPSGAPKPSLGGEGPAVKGYGLDRRSSSRGAVCGRAD